MTIQPDEVFIPRGDSLLEEFESYFVCPRHPLHQVVPLADRGDPEVGRGSEREREGESERGREGKWERERGSERGRENERKIEIERARETENSRGIPPGAAGNGEEDNTRRESKEIFRVKTNRPPAQTADRRLR